MSNKTGRWILFSLGLLLALAVTGLGLRTIKSSEPPPKIPFYTQWDERTLEIASRIPIQDGGRVKPLVAYAGFKMLAMNGKRSLTIRDKDDAKVDLKPMGWMMDCLFRPILAKQLPTFRVNDTDVVAAAGIAVTGKTGRYSYDDLLPHLPELKKLGESYRQITVQNPKAELKPVEIQTITLCTNIIEFEFLCSYLDAAREGLVAGGKQGGQMLDVSLAMGAADRIREEIQQAQAANQAPSQQALTVAQLLIDSANSSLAPVLLFPPSNADDRAWLSLGNRIYNVLTGATREPEMGIKDVKSLETLSRSVNDPAVFAVNLKAFQEGLAGRATQRGEYATVEKEVSFIQMDLTFTAFVLCVMGILTAAIMFFTGDSIAGKITYWLTMVLTVVALCCIVTAIVQRCLIMHRPPVGNLYDTFIFIAMAKIILGLAVEGLTRRKFALGVAPIVAALLLLRGMQFEAGDPKDQLDPLGAVLLDNYWLATHVIMITLGYAAGLMTSILSVVYVLLRALGLDKEDPSIRRALTRAVYGCVCLTTLLALVGTVLGGIWANDSWGRFWGWDPKENGALMIVLWNLAILHARAGGYIKEWGLHLASLFGAIVIGFSWWHVNQLGVGLHSYGFSTTEKNALHIYYGVSGGLLLLGIGTCLFERISKARTKAEQELAKRSPLEA